MFSLQKIIAHQLYVISSFGNNFYILGAAFIIVFYYLFRRGHKVTAFVALFSAASYMYSVYLKEFFKIPRPIGADLAQFNQMDIFSFPSSHVLFYTVFWGFVLYVTFKYKKEDKLIMHTLRTFAAYFISTIGISRIYFEVHHLYDVIAGYIFGLIFLGILIYLDKNIYKIFAKNK